MAVYDRWHKTHPKQADTPCRCSRGKHKLYPSTEHGKGDRWQVRWVDLDGKARKANRPKKGGGDGEGDPEVYAEALDAKITADLNAGTYVDPSAGKKLFRTYAEEVVENRTLDPGTRVKMRERLTKHAYPVIGDIELRVLARRPSLVQALVRKVGDTCADSTAQLIMANVGVVFSSAVAEELIPKNPMDSPVVKVPRPVKERVVPWTAEQVAAMREAMPDDCAAMIDVGAGLGLRQGEILGLSPDDIDWVSDVVHVRRQVKKVGRDLLYGLPKGRKTRDIPLPPLVKQALQEHRAAHPPQTVTLPWEKPGGEERAVRLFFSSGGKAHHRDWFAAGTWRPSLERAGIVAAPLPGERRKPVGRNGMHALRHYFGSFLITEGESVKAVSEWMGHHNASVTLGIYVHLMPKSEQRMKVIMDRALAVPERRASARKVPDPGSG
jgi:integrase